MWRDICKYLSETNYFISPIVINFSNNDDKNLIDSLVIVALIVKF